MSIWKYILFVYIVLNTGADAEGILEGRRCVCGGGGGGGRKRSNPSLTQNFIFRNFEFDKSLTPY